jgi:hypothetical protein
MKLLTRTIIVLCVGSLTAAIPVSAMMAASKDKTLTISGSVGLPGVQMTGLPGNPTSGPDGNYSATVPSGFTGRATPIKEGYRFEPSSREYTALTANFANHDYAPSIITFTISGTAGVDGVRIQGLPSNVVTDRNGYYQAKLPYGWSGIITPRKEGFTFEPASLHYTKVVADERNDDYAAKPEMLAISGRIMVGGHPIEDALISADNKGGSDVTDAEGRYSLKVPHGWSGVVTPKKEGMAFNPPGQTYTNVTTDMVDGEPALTRGRGTDPYAGFGSSRPRSGRQGYSSEYDDMMYGQSGSPPRGMRSSGYKPAIRSGGRKVLVIPAEEVNAKEFAETIEDMHVMSHILDEQFKEARRIQGMFTDFGAFFGRDSRNTEATYLQGYGVLFLMEVNFAFSPPPKPQAQEPEETTEAVDSTWQKARRQVLSPGTSPGMDEEDSANDYDSQMVEELKKELVQALKHASNIRNVKPDEWIILTVIGGQRQFGAGFGGVLPMGGSMSRSQSSTRGGASAGGMGGYSSSSGYTTSSYGGAGGIMYGGMEGYTGGMYGEMAPPNKTAFSSSTVLTIRAKKSDVDDFAKGALDFDQFQKKVTILMY